MVVERRGAGSNVRENVRGLLRKDDVANVVRPVVVVLDRGNGGCHRVNDTARDDYHANAVARRHSGGQAEVVLADREHVGDLDDLDGRGRDRARVGDDRLLDGDHRASGGGAGGDGVHAEVAERVDAVEGVLT